MLHKIFLFGFLFLAHMGNLEAFAQNVSNTGNCNGNIVGSGNNIVINCGADVMGGKVVLVATERGLPTIDFGLEYEAVAIFLHRSRSTMRLQIGDEEYEKSLRGSFEGAIFRPNTGPQIFKMELELVWLRFDPSIKDDDDRNVFRTTFSQCSGVIDVKSNAAIRPIFEVHFVEEVANIGSVDCYFELFGSNVVQ